MTESQIPFTTVPLVFFALLYLFLVVAITKKYFKDGKFVALLIYLTLTGLFPVSLQILSIFLPQVNLLLEERYIVLLMLGPIFIGLYYLTRNNLDIKSRGITFYLAIVYTGICVFLFNIAPFSGSLETTSIKAEQLYNIALVTSTAGIFFWFSSLYALYTRSLNSHSLVKRNRFKAIYLSQLLIGIGLILSIINNPYTLVVYMVAIIFGIIVLGYALFRYEHMHISSFFLNILRNVFLVTIGVTIYLSTTTLSKAIISEDTIFSDIFSVILLMLLITPIYKPISNLFVSSKEKVLLELLRDFVEFYKTDKRDKQKIFDYIEEQLVEYLNVQEVHMVVTNPLEKETTLDFLGKRKGDLKKSLSLEIIDSLDGLSMIELPSPEYVNLNRVWKNHNVKLIFVLKKREEMIGLLILGYKVGGESYSIDEIKFLSQLSGEIVMALDNYYLIEQLNLDKQSIKKLYDQEKDLNDLKSDFIQISSHNLRTPLTALKGYIELLEKTTKKSERKEYTLKIKKHLMKLSTMTEELVAFASLAGSEDHIKLMKRPSKYDLLVKKVVNDYIPIAEDKGLSLTLEVDSKIVCEIDELKINVVLENIIDNAIKYSDTGSIKVVLTKGKDYITTSVIDTGIGIEEKEQELLFKKFSRITSDKPYINKREGTGLGLYIARLFVNAHGGDIYVKSIEGKGSEFTFTLPT